MIGLFSEDLYVSILVVLDVVLEDTQKVNTGITTSSFNPCCAGCSSGRVVPFIPSSLFYLVSILVVLDVVLEESL